jgi:hypothetical protein
VQNPRPLRDFVFSLEAFLKAYGTIPGPPGPENQITKARSRLRATITVSKLHARNIGGLLIQRTEEKKKSEITLFKQ